MRAPHFLLPTYVRAAAATVVAFLFLIPSLATAQSPVGEWSVGVSAGLTHNRHGGLGATGFESDCWETAPGGRAIGYVAGIAVETRLSDLFSINTRIAYESRDGMVVNRPTDARLVRMTYIPSPTDPTIEVIVTDDSVVYRSELDCELLTADAQLDAEMFRASSTMALHGLAGFSISKILRGTATRAREVSPYVREATLPYGEGSEVEDGGRRVVDERDREVPGLRELRLALKGGIALTIDLSQSLYMRNGIYVDLGVNDLSGDPRWTLGSTFMQIDFMVRL
jgi:hypothetical protein